MIYQNNCIHFNEILLYLSYQLYYHFYQLILNSIQMLNFKIYDNKFKVSSIKI